MVNWGALLEAPLGVMLLLVAVLMIAALQVPLFATLDNAEAFPYGSATKVFVHLLTLVLGMLILYGTYLKFLEKEPPQQVMRQY